jgi:hypothetical protein
MYWTSGAGVDRCGPRLKCECSLDHDESRTQPSSAPERRATCLNDTGLMVGNARLVTE